MALIETNTFRNFNSLSNRTRLSASLVYHVEHLFHVQIPSRNIMQHKI